MKTKIDKRILASVMVIGIAMFAIGMGTIAYFSDTETATHNVFSTGTIDIAIDNQNPWEGHFNLLDMKPCETAYITFNVTNEGSNPANIYKHIDVTDDMAGLADVIDYDLHAKVYDSQDALIWWQGVYDGEIAIGDIESTNVLVGMIPINGRMEITQSYHMQAEAGNEYQDTLMIFDIEVIAQQLTGNLILENKDSSNDKWLIQHDGTSGELDYNLKGPTFDYTFEAEGLDSTEDYCLIYYADPWAGNNPGALIASFVTDGSGDIASTSGSKELNMDLPDPADVNHLAGAKIWLVLCDDYDEVNGMTAWKPNEYLFETALITYDDNEV